MTMARRLGRALVLGIALVAALPAMEIGRAHV